MSAPEDPYRKHPSPLLSPEFLERERHANAEIAAWKAEWTSRFGAEYPEAEEDLLRLLARFELQPELADHREAALRAIEQRLLYAKFLAEQKGDVNRPGPPFAREPAVEARDKWLYERCCNREPYKNIIRAQDKKPRTWPRITTVQGIKKAASAYAARHELPPIPKRSRGRTGGKKN